jgi:L-rhamnose-H+ transport protein
VGLPVILVILLGGLTTNFIWCVILHVKNGSAHQYFSPTVKPVAGHTQGGTGHGEKISGEVFELGSKVPLLPNYLFCICAGTLWYLQFFFYQMGESQMGNYKFSSWTLHMASIIIFSTLWGIFFKEWKGAAATTKKLVVVMLLFLVGSTVIIGLGNKKSEDAAAEAAKAKIEAVVPAAETSVPAQ